MLDVEPRPGPLSGLRLDMNKTRGLIPLGGLELRQAWQGKQKVVLSILFRITLMSVVYSMSHSFSLLYVFMHSSLNGHLDEDEGTPP